MTLRDKRRPHNGEVQDVGRAPEKSRVIRRAPAYPGVTKRLAKHLRGAALPIARLESLHGPQVRLNDLSAGWLIVYCFPGSHVGNDESHADDERDHQAYTRCHDVLQRRAIRLASLSSEPRDLQTQAMLTHRLPHYVLLDPELLIADALGLPTFSDGTLRAYSRLTLIARAGHIEHVFYPMAQAGRGAQQAIAWLRATGQ